MPGGGSSELEDLIQEVFVRAFSEKGRLAYDGLRDYEPYICTIARNLLIDRARKQGREVPLDWDAETPARGMPRGTGVAPILGERGVLAALDVEPEGLVTRVESRPAVGLDLRVEGLLLSGGDDGERGQHGFACRARPVGAVGKAFPRRATLW